MKEKTFNKIFNGSKRVLEFSLDVVIYRLLSSVQIPPAKRFVNINNILTNVGKFTADIIVSDKIKESLDNSPTIVELEKTLKDILVGKGDGNGQCTNADISK